MSQTSRRRCLGQELEEIRNILLTDYQRELTMLCTILMFTGWCLDGRKGACPSYNFKVSFFFLESTISAYPGLY